LNIAVGDTAGALLIAGNNNIDIANAAVAAESNTIRIGNVVPFTDLTNLVHPVHTATYIAGISGATVAKSAAVFIDANGRLGTKSSSQRFKDEIKPMDKASEAIHALTPVTFRYKNEIDPDGTPQFGLVAEDVAKVNPDLVVRDAEGKIHTVRYDAVNAMLLNEFLKDHRKVEEQDATISQLKKDFRATVAELTARLKEQDSKIEKVGAQFEVSKPARQMVANNQ
jgi:predicted ribosome quality control (RQC) complex YloA/Tae2 family protein